MSLLCLLTHHVQAPQCAQLPEEDLLGHTTCGVTILMTTADSSLLHHGEYLRVTVFKHPCQLVWLSKSFTHFPRRFLVFYLLIARSFLCTREISPSPIIWIHKKIPLMVFAFCLCLFCNCLVKVSFLCAYVCWPWLDGFRIFDTTQNAFSTSGLVRNFPVFSSYLPFFKHLEFTVVYTVR